MVGRGEEGAVAGAAVEDQAVFQDQAFLPQQSEQAARLPAGRRDVDREALVVVAGPVDVAFEEDFVAGEFEAEAGRLAGFRFDVVDGDFGQPARSAATGCRAAAASGDVACPDFGAGGQPTAPASKVASLQRTVAPGLTLSPTGRSTRTVFSSSTGVSPGGFVLDDELGEAPVRVGARRFEELVRGGDRAERPRSAVRRCRCRPASRSRPTGAAGRSGR